MNKLNLRIFNKRPPSVIKASISCIVIILVILIAYQPIVDNNFINFDDYPYLVNNANVRTGLHLDSIKWAFFSGHEANWTPVTWISYMIDCELFGINPVAHHLINLFFHILNSLILLWILIKMTGKRWLSIAVALLFAVHPIHVESVAWAAERKDVLSTFFGLLTIISYYYYTNSPNIRKYFIMMILFILGILSKPMLVTLPFLLLLIDYWPLQRVTFSITGPKKKKNLFDKQVVRKLIIEKIPLFILVILLSITTIMVHRTWSTLADFDKIPLSFRVLNVFNCYIQYIIKMIYPVNLAVYYSHPGERLSVFGAIISLLILLCISFFILYLNRNKKYLSVGWLWYIISLLPVIGIVQVGNYAMADRYSYIPSIGINIMIIWGIHELSKNLMYRRVILGTLSVLIIICLIFLTRKQVGFWKDDITLFGHAIKSTEDNFLVYNYYGEALYKKKQYDQAMINYKKSASINPFYLKARQNICKVLLFTGKIDQAVTCYEELIKLKNDDALLYHNLGFAYLKQGNDSLAIRYLEKSLEIEPGYPKALYNLGEILKKNGRLNEAIRSWQLLLQNRPEIPEAYLDKPYYLKASIKLINLYYKMGYIKEAIKTAEETAQLAQSLKKNNIAREMERQIQLYKNMYHNK